MVMVKCTKRNDDCLNMWNYIGSNIKNRKYITCTKCYYKIPKEKAIRAYQEWKEKNKKDAEKLEMGLGL